MLEIIIDNLEILVAVPIALLLILAIGLTVSKLIRKIMGKKGKHG